MKGGFKVYTDAMGNEVLYKDNTKEYQWELLGQFKPAIATVYTDQINGDNVRTVYAAHPLSSDNSSAQPVSSKNKAKTERALMKSSSMMISLPAIAEDSAKAAKATTASSPQSQAYEINHAKGGVHSDPYNQRTDGGAWTPLNSKDSGSDVEIAFIEEPGQGTSSENSLNKTAEFKKSSIGERVDIGTLNIAGSGPQPKDGWVEMVDKQKENKNRSSQFCWSGD